MSERVTFELWLGPSDIPRPLSTLLLALTKALRCSIEDFGLFERMSPEHVRFELNADLARRIRTPESILSTSNGRVELFTLQRSEDAAPAPWQRLTVQWEEEAPAPKPGFLQRALSAWLGHPLEAQWVGLPGKTQLQLLTRLDACFALPEGPLTFEDRTFSLRRSL